MVRRWCVHLLTLVCVFSTAYARSSPAGHTQKTVVAKLPVTTASAEARKDFERAMGDFEEYRLRDCLQNLRAATKADSKFAQAFILISRLTGDPTEQAEARKAARDLTAGGFPRG